MKFRILSIALVLSCCGKPAPKPADADIAAYLAQSAPPYVRISGVTPTFEAVKDNGDGKVVPGSWRVSVAFTLHTTEDLYGPVGYAGGQRAAFDKVVRGFEMYRTERVAAAEQLAQRVGLMKAGDAAPEPAVPVHVINRAGQDLPDHVTLLAQPDGAHWKFFQLDAQSLGDDVIGAPVATLRQSAPRTIFVVEGSPDDRTYQQREQRYLETLNKAAAP
jgi:hypothetical protein